ncbi:MAG: hypothetical protein KME45_16395 [Stenomitos rutilans HA7619-LM2]|nr:hypothetical protein [Stenomitos rutilans HA7619-LM2]
MSNQTSQISVASELEAALSTQQLLAVGEHKRSGLIICKAHHAEFAGPGAIVGSPVEQACMSMIAIGAPELTPVVTSKQRQAAYSRRIQWSRWLQKITEHTDATQRAEKLFASFEEFFGAPALMALSDEVLALLIGVMPFTVAAVRSHYSWPQSVEEKTLIASYEPNKFNAARFVPRSLHANAHLPAKTYASVWTALYNTPSRD